MALKKKHIAIVGGGISGLTAALELTAKRSHKVTIFEKSNQIGGLSTWFNWQDVTWDKYYHVVLTSDTETLQLLDELGLRDQLFWRETKSGFYGDGKLVSMSTTLDLLRFPFMSLWQKFRMGLGILYSSRLKDSSRLDRLYAKQWLTKIFGRRVYENIWDPLLRSKLGSASEQTSAMFIWATIKRLYGARQGQDKKERMGHVAGGYHTILSAMSSLLDERGVEVQLSEPVERLISDQDSFRLITKKKDYKFDQILFTIDCPAIEKILDPYIDQSDPYWQRLKSIKYLGVVCLLLILKRKLSSYYVINLLDKELPFTGIIEATNVVSPDQVGNNNLIFLPKYAPANDSVFSDNDAEVFNEFIQNLKKVYPELQDDDIVHWVVHRNRYVQPIQSLNYKDQMPAFNTPLSNVYISNTAMVVNSTLNNNTSISLAKQCCKVINSKCENSEPSTRCF